MTCLHTNPVRNHLAITVDIEDWYHVPSVSGSPYSVYKNVDEFFQFWIEKYDYLTEPTNRVLTMLENHKVKATFFVVADVVQHYPGLIEAIRDGGHEIACHGMHHECIIDPETRKPLINRNTFISETKKAKKILEKISDSPVIGYRAPNAYISGWMIDCLEEIGFRYDSSVSANSFYNKTDSALVNVDSTPYYPQKNSLEPSQEQRQIIEFPFAQYCLPGFTIPSSGGPILRFLGSYIIYRGLLQSLKKGTTIFYFHPIDIAYERFPPVGNKRPFYWLIKGAIVENRIEKILKKSHAIPKHMLKDLISSPYDRVCS